MDMQVLVEEGLVLSTEQVGQFIDNGFVVLEDIVDVASLEIYNDIFWELSLSCSHEFSKEDENEEGLLELKFPGATYPLLYDMPAHRLSLGIARQLMGEDMWLEYDTFMCESDDQMPWRQENANHPPLPDPRGLSCLVALDDATTENGGLWMAPGSHTAGALPHITNNEGKLECIAPFENIQPVELPAGSAVVYNSFTVHCNRGNSANSKRRAIKTSFRPVDIVNYLDPAKLN